jgi:hypothetical protein
MPITIRTRTPTAIYIDLDSYAEVDIVSFALVK